MPVQATEQFKSATQQPYVDPSVVYAEAVLNGEEFVTIQGADGKPTTYHIGHEFNRDQ